MGDEVTCPICQRALDPLDGKCGSDEAECYRIGYEREKARADAATAKAEQYERDWYAAKSDFGTAMAKSREALAAARRECELPESVKLIVAERRRQVGQERWTPEHDDEHNDGELAAAASCYAWPDKNNWMPLHWPWSSDWWKPGKDRIRQLVKAGALIAAEIERLQCRAALAAPAAGEEGKR